MKNFRLVVTRIDASGSVLVVPFAETLDFRIRSVFKDSDFVALLKRLGMHSDEAQLTLDRSHAAPRSFELRLALSKEQSECVCSYFPQLVEALCSVE